MRGRGLAAAGALAVALAGGCRCRDDRAAAPDDAARPADAARATRFDAAPSADPAWRALDGLPRAYPRWATQLPERPVPAIDAHGPVVVDGAAVVASSTAGVVGLDLADGAVRFSRPIHGRVAPPAPLGDHLLAIGDCTYPVDPPAGHAVVGCYELLDRRAPAVWGAGSIVAPAEAASALGGGATRLARSGRDVWLGRADGWIALALAEPARGEVRARAAARRDVPAHDEEPRLSVGDGDDRVDLWIADDVLELRHHDPAALSDRSAVRAIAGAPGALHDLGDGTVRGFRLVDGEAAVRPAHIDPRAVVIDDAGAAVPGIGLLAAAHGARGFAAAIRLDSSLAHDYVAGFSPAGEVVWVWPLPPPPGGGRVLPVGLAFADDAVVVFHDGAIVAALPAP